MRTSQEIAELYGVCPQCGSICSTRERRPNGNDTCVKGHVYPSRDAVSVDKGQLSSPGWLPDLLAALGWQGGTVHDALAEVRKLREWHDDYKMDSTVEGKR